MRKVVGVITVFTLLVTGCGSTNASWAFGFVNWNHSTYRVTEQTVSSVGKEIGTVTKYSDSEGNYNFDGFSNQFPVGTKLYSIVGEDTNKLIAIQQMDGSFIEAVNLKYDSWKGGPPN